MVSPTKGGAFTGPSYFTCADRPGVILSSGIDGGWNGSGFFAAPSAATPPAARTPLVTRPAGGVAASFTVLTSGSASTLSLSALPACVSRRASPVFSSASFFFSSSLFSLTTSCRCKGDEVGTAENDQPATLPPRATRSEER